MFGLSKGLRKSQNFSRADTSPAAVSSVPSSSSSAVSQTEICYGVKTLHDNGNSTIDILFVHGLNGHRERTWQAKDVSDPWPRALLPLKIPKARILTFGYDAQVANWSGMISTNTIRQHARNMLSAIATHRAEDDTSNRPIIFVCHSLGGLVCQDALSWANQTSEEHLVQILDCTRGIGFFGTPHHGSALTHWAEGLAKLVGLIQETNDRILDVLRSDSEVLARVQDSFHEMIKKRRERRLPNINISCFYEELGLPGIGLVVPRQSTVIPGAISLGIRANHMDMTKFKTSDDPGFTAVVGELSRWCKSISAPDSSSGNMTERMANASSSGSIPSVPRKGCSTMPFDKDPKFIGREDVIEQIDKQFESKNRIVLCGLGGVGKSQIAIEYAYRFQEKYPDAHVFWVYSSSASNMHHGYSRIAEELGQNSQHVNVIRLVCQSLKSSDSGRWLLILDNLDDVKGVQSGLPEGNGPGMELSEYIPSSTKGLILVTTRDKSTGRYLTDNPMMEIELMNPSEARLLFQSRLAPKVTVDQDQAGELVKALDHLPLAITQAAAFILNSEMSLEIYLGLVRKGEDEISDLMTEEEKDPRRDGQRPSSVFRTWSISFNKIRETKPRAAQMLCLMAVLDRQGIPEVLLKRPGETDSLFQKCLGLLKAFSLISPTKYQNILAMHRLVQLAARKWIELNKNTHKYEREALKALARTFPVGDWENLDEYDVFLPHMQAVMQYNFPTELDLPRANLLHNLAFYALDQGLFLLALKRFSEALCLRTRATKLEANAEALRSLYYIAIILGLEGQYEEAQRQHQAVLDYRTALLGRNHQDTIKSMHALGRAFFTLENYKASKDLYQQTLKRQNHVLGPEHPAAISTISDLADVFYKLKMHNEALDMKIQALELRKKVYGSKTILTVFTMNDLVYLLYLVQTDHAPITIKDQLIKQGIKSLATAFPCQPEIMNDLVANLSQGRRQNHASIVQQIFDMCARIYRHEHLAFVVCVAHVASYLFNLRNYHVAENIHRRVLKLCSKFFGPIYQEALSTMLLPDKCSFLVEQRCIAMRCQPERK